MASPDEEAARDFLAVDSQARPPSQPSQSLSARGARRVWISLGFLIVVVGTLAMAWEEIPSYLSLKMRVSPESPMQIRPELQDPQHELGHPKRMLFVVHSDSNFYSSRVKWVMETWGKDLTNETTLIIIGDSVPKDDLGGIIRATGCPSHSHNRGLDCKVSQDLIQADVAMQQDPSLAWAFIVDDDAYVRTDALSSFLLPKDGKGKHGKGVALGIFGCGTTDPECGGLLCGGGGLVMSREAVRITVAGPEGRGPKAFAREVAENFKRNAASGATSRSQRPSANEAFSSPPCRAFTGGA
ncbi:unnamed protein product [Effrenium voratum]|nr:unnamed protein product [Effrenium voratum]